MKKNTLQGIICSDLLSMKSVPDPFALGGTRVSFQPNVQREWSGAGYASESSAKDGDLWTAGLMKRMHPWEALKARRMLPEWSKASNRSLSSAHSLRRCC